MIFRLLKQLRRGFFGGGALAPILVFVSLLLAGSGCASKTARIEQFSKFADAGVAYQEA